MTSEVEPPASVIELYETAAEDATCEDVLHETDEVLSVLQDQLQEAADPMTRLEELAAANRVLVTVAKDYDDPESVIDHTDSYASDIASTAQIKKDKILAGVLGLTREYRNEKDKEEIEEKLDETAESESSGQYTLEDGYALDEYLETTDKVVKLDSEDHVNDPAHVFKFADGTQVRVEDGDHLSRELLYRVVESGSDEQIRNEIVSTEAAGDITTYNKEEAEEQYSLLSHGPEERPWGMDVVLDSYQKDAWNKCITHLVDKKKVKQETSGPCTDAWSDLQAKIKNTRAAKDKQSVVSHGGDGVFYHVENEELWVPTSMVSTAAEEYATSRTQLAYELHERGVTSDELSGRNVSTAARDVSPPTRFWRLDRLHPDVPEPEPIVDTFDEMNDAFGGSEVTTDGGTTTFGGADE